MHEPLLTLNRGGIDYRKLFGYLIALELVTMAFMVTGDTFLMAGYAVVILGLLVLLFIPKEPVIGIPLMFIATGLDFFGSIGPQSDLFTFTYFHIFMMMTFLSVFMYYLLRGITRIPSCSLWAPFFAYLFVVAITLTFTPLFTEGFVELVRSFVLGLLTFAIILSITTRNHLKWVSWSFVLVPTLVSGYIIYEIFTKGTFFQTQVLRMATELGIPVYRSTGMFHNPNVLAMFIMVGIVTGFSLLLIQNLKWHTRVALLIALGISGVAMIGTFSRGSWVATMAGIFLVVLFNRKWSYFFYFIGFFLLTVAVLAIVHPEIILTFLNRFISIFQVGEEASASSRLSLARMGIWMWLDHPILGVGVAGYSYYVPTYFDPNMPQALSYVVLPHTIQIKILAEEGIIGLTLATWFFATIVFHGVKSINRIRDDFGKKLQIAMTSLIIAFVVAFTVNSDMHNNIFYITIGVLYAIPLVYRNLAGEPEWPHTLPG